MPARLSSHLRSSVIQQWLQGDKRDDIAHKNAISTGAVSSIIDSWKYGSDAADAGALRELALALKKLGITSIQCASGLRITMKMNKLGVNGDSLDLFLSDVYERCTSLGLAPADIASHLRDLLAFSKNVPISKIPDYIDSKRREKKRMEEEIEDLQDEIADLEAEKSAVEELKNSALEQEKLITSTTRWYAAIKKELEDEGLSVDDIPKFANAINGLRKYGYNIQEIVEEFSHLQMLKLNQKGLNENIAKLEKDYHNLNQDVGLLKNTKRAWQQTISMCADLYDMGFRLNELRLLRDTVVEISVANDIPSDEAVSRFFNDIDEQYSVKVGFEIKIKELQERVNLLAQEEARAQRHLFSLPLVGPCLARLMQRGFYEQDIIDLVQLIENHRSSKGFRFTIQEVKSLMLELLQYEDTKAAVDELSSRLQQLKSETDWLDKKRAVLRTEIEKMLSVLLWRPAGFCNACCMSA